MENSNSNFFKNLNENQKKSVIDLNGPCLIVAGAGSGKTRVLTTRVAYIIEQKKAWPNQILCVTFTNKAAREMQNRISKLLRKQNTAIPWLGTFHSLSAKFLRKQKRLVAKKPPATHDRARCEAYYPLTAYLGLLIKSDQVLQTWK